MFLVFQLKLHMPDICISLSDPTLISTEHFQLFLNIRLGGKRSYFTQIKTHLVQDDVTSPCSDILQKYTDTCSNPLFFLFLMLLHYLISYYMSYFLDLKYKVKPATPSIQIRNLLPKARNFF